MFLKAIKASLQKDNYWAAFLGSRTELQEHIGSAEPEAEPGFLLTFGDQPCLAIEQFNFFKYF